MAWRMIIRYCFVSFISTMFVFSASVFPSDKQSLKKTTPHKAKNTHNYEFHKNYRTLIQSVNTPQNEAHFKDTFIEDYLKTLTVKLSRTQPGLEYLRDKESLVPEEARFAMYNGEIKGVKGIERAILITSVWNAGADIYKKTEFSRKVKRFERSVSKYFVMEYSRSLSDQKGDFYLPGELTYDKMKEKKEYRVTLTSLIYPGETSLKPDLSMTLNILLFKSVASTSYSFEEQSTAIGVASLYFNDISNTETGVSIIRHPEESTVYLLKTSVNF